MAKSNILPFYFEEAFESANGIGGADDASHFVEIMDCVIAEAEKQRAACRAAHNLACENSIIEKLQAALLSAPIIRIDESPKDFKERYSAWHRTDKHETLTLTSLALGKE